MSLPTIDISPFLSNTDNTEEDKEAKKLCAQQVHNACTETGFFLISNFQKILPQEKLDSMFNLSLKFFSLPVEDKKKIKGFENRGYFAIGEENLTTVYTQLNEVLVNKDLGDFKEGLDIGREPDSEIGPFRRKNEWPESLGEEWKKEVLEYFQNVSKIGNVLTRIFAVALNLEENWFDDKMNKPQAMLRLLHYPPLPLDEARFSCGAHSDYGCCTVLAQDGTGGLQLLNTNGTWVNIFKSTVHRVINPSGKHRFSIPFFFEPNYDAVVECLETCKNEKNNFSAKYPPIKFGDHLTNMYNVTYVQPK